MSTQGKPALADGSVADLLWRDPSIFRARFEKAASALVAVRRSIARHAGRFAGAAEFADDYAALTADADAFTHVWQDPYAYFWVRRAFELVGAVLRGEPLPAAARGYATALVGHEGVDAAVAAHLQELKRLVLGVAVRTGGDVAFTTPLAIEPPFAIPGAGRSLLGTGPVRLLGCRRGRLEVERAGRRGSLPLEGGADGGLRIEAAPRVAVGDGRIDLQPHLYRIPGLGLHQEETQADFDFQRRQLGRLEAALALVERYSPEAHALLGRCVRVVGLQARNPVGYRDNVSHSDLPGAILACAEPHPYYLADILVHESHHNRLFFVEEAEPFLASTPDDLETDAGYCSPWREDLRPLHGLLHGAYVFVPTTRFWLRVLEAGQTDADTRALALDRAVRGLTQTRVGLYQLGKHARFGALGSRVFAQLERDVAALEADFERAGLPGDAPFVVFHADGRIEVARDSTGAPLGGRDALIGHLRRCGAPDQAEDIIRHAL